MELRAVKAASEGFSRRHVHTKAFRGKGVVTE